MDREKLKDKLSNDEFDITQNKGTEAPFSGKYLDNKETGVYRCVCCNQELFSSKHKYDSGSGWPSFYDVTSHDNLSLINDTSHGMMRTEVTCANCGAHLGHVFNDGPRPTNLRYCINSLSLKLLLALKVFFVTLVFNFSLQICFKGLSPLFINATFSTEISKPITLKPASTSAIESGMPTYPRPNTPTKAVRSLIFLFKLLLIWELCF